MLYNEEKQKKDNFELLAVLLFKLNKNSTVVTLKMKEAIVFVNSVDYVFG